MDPFIPIPRLPAGVSVAEGGAEDAARLAALHRRLYCAPAASGGRGFDARFAAAVADGLADFMATRAPGRDLFVAARGPDGFCGGAILDARPERAEPSFGDARLRFVAVAPELQGRGLGAALIAALLTRARALGCRTVWLDTLAGLDAAARLYERVGFRRVFETAHADYGPVVRQKRLRLDLAPGP